MNRMVEITQWETIYVPANVKTSDTIKQVNKLGEQGWEPFSKDEGSICLKRPKGVMLVEMEETYVKGSPRNSGAAISRESYENER